jgi:hypothetical protein
MMMHTDDDGFVSISAVVGLRRARSRDGDIVTRLTDAKGSTLGTVRGDPCKVSGLFAPMLPAAPGFFIVIPHDPPDDGYSTDPVVAWKIDRDGTPEAIGAEGSQTCANRQAILRPDGRVFIPYDRSFGNVEKWLDYEKTLKAERDGRKPGPAQV